jgi:hypothetical protein
LEFPVTECQSGNTQYVTAGAMYLDIDTDLAVAGSARHPSARVRNGYRTNPVPMLAPHDGSAGGFGVEAPAGCRRPGNLDQKTT